MRIYDQLQDRLRQASVQQDKATRTSLRTVIGEIQTREKRTGQGVDDALCIKVLRDAVSANTDSLGHRESAALRAENALLQPFIDAHSATLLSAQAITRILRDANVTSLPEAMKYLKAQYHGAYDGKTASAVARDLFG